MLRTRHICLAVLAVLSLLLVLLTGSFAFLGVADTGDTVVRVYDGDTVALSNGNKIRYLGINAPEVAHKGRPGEPLAYEALNLNKRLTLGKQIRLEFDKTTRDQYGRILAYVYLPDGSFINAILVEQGLATVYATPPNLKHEQFLLKLQQRAMREHRGLWSAMGPGTGVPCIGNMASRRFHAPSCPFGQKTAGHNVVKFNDRMEAFYRGFSPCKKCNP